MTTGQTLKPATSWSLSAVGCYEKCQLKARYKYVERRPEVRSDAAGRGIDFHKDIENFLIGASPTLPSNLDYYTSWFTELKKHEIYPEHIIRLKQDWTPAQENEAHWYKGILDLKVVRRQESVESLPEGTERTQLQAPPIEVIIYDWKTGRVYPDHDDQKSLYSVATFAEHPSVFSVRAIHVYVDLRQIREKTFHRDQMHELRTAWDGRAGKFLEALKNPEGMIANPGFHCRYCSFSAAKGGPCRF